MFGIGDKLTRENYTQGAIWCNKNGCAINPDTWTIEPVSEPDAKEAAQAKINQLKAQLASTDYIDNKFLEALVKEDSELLSTYKIKYKDKLEERQSIRNQIDELEEQINGGQYL